MKSKCDRVFKPTKTSRQLHGQVKSALATLCLAPIVFAATALFATQVTAYSTYHVNASRGNDRNGDGSLLRPWSTIGYAIGKLAASDTLIVHDGLYTGPSNFINSRKVRIPSGDRQRPTVIRAANPFKVRIKNEKPLNYHDQMLLLDQGTQHVIVDGFIFDMTDTLHPSYVAEINGSNIKLVRTIVRRQGMVDDYGGWIALGGHDNLVEDCAGVGAARYGFFVGGPDARVERNIFRRCVGRIDFSASRQPKATFAVYGNNTGHNVRDILLQNCIAIDGQRGPRDGEDTYAGFYFPKNATNVTVQGSIALNLQVAYAGFFIRELAGKNIRLEQSIAWNIHGGESVSGIRLNGKSADAVAVENVTVGATRYGYYNRDYGARKSLLNSLFVDVEGRADHGDLGWSVEQGNVLVTRGQRRSDGKRFDPALLMHLPSPSLAAIAQLRGPGKNVGATIVSRYGKEGTFWGEPGYDQLTAVPLWPWPNEVEIRDIFAEPNAPLPGNVPQTNPTTRGFAAPMDLLGRPNSLTRYVWQYLGEPIR